MQEGLPPHAESSEMNNPNFSVIRISEGLAFGHGTISSQESEPEVLSLVDETIHYNPNILVPISRDDDGSVISDDGCGDGREVTTVFSHDKTYKRSLNRSKVFGGAATMGTATLIGTRQAQHIALNEIFDESISALTAANLDFGAHTDEHAVGSHKNCGCGAIDKAPAIIFATLRYEDPIRSVLAVLGIDNNEDLENVTHNFRQYVAQYATYLGEHQDDYHYYGKEIMDHAIDKGIVVKQLGGAHKERRIVLNQVRGYTVNQQLIREATNDEAQIFAVDVWRMEDIAKKLYDSQPDLQGQAFISELIYTLATAAVLTKGDLPVDMITESVKPAA